ncbi:VWA domain-containing protein [Corynebacterium sp. A21]|uniref:VWA domain-containing protein n=1 Tax=Corynebacterium sp. A21 TaxID=3457318 RepID=UPI003FD4F35A
MNMSMNGTATQFLSGSAARFLIVLFALLIMLFLAACGGAGTGTSGTGVPDASDTAGAGSGGESLKIAAATELADIQPLIDRASTDLGFDIELSFPDGTLANSHALKAGEFDGQFDATWFATNRYVNLLGASDKLGESIQIATSPVAFGVRSDKAEGLGWVASPPTWSQIADTAATGDLSYGMTDPATSNSGFSAVVAVATALADTGNALSIADIDANAEELTDFFSGQQLASGSSGWLRDAFMADPDRVDALINYESVLHGMAAEGADIEVIVPSDGVISADYPLSTLANPANEQAPTQVRALGDWLNENPAAIVDTYRRPAATAQLPPEMSEQILIELPFPGDITVTDRLIAAYTNELRVPGEIMFVLDTSGSMAGGRIADLKETMNQLIDGSASTTTGTVGLREREQITILPFSSEVHLATTVTFGEGEAAQQLKSAVDGLQPGGETALYAALQEAYGEINEAGGGSIPSMLLLTDGEVTAGPSLDTFSAWVQDQSGKLPPTFVIRYGEADPREMQRVAELTGGRSFEAGETNLNEAFKEIRGYQ